MNDINKKSPQNLPQNKTLGWILKEKILYFQDKVATILLPSWNIKAPRPLPGKIWPKPWY